MLFLILLQRFEGYLLGFFVVVFTSEPDSTCMQFARAFTFSCFNAFIKKKKEKDKHTQKIPLPLRHTQDSENAFLSGVHHNGIWIRPEATVKCIYFLLLLE